MSRTKLCYEYSQSTPQWPIRLEQAGKDNFTVRYGKQIDQRLTYSEACAKLGQAIMHSLACDGLLDNREKNER